MKYRYLYRGNEQSVELLPGGDALQVILGGEGHAVRVLGRGEGRLELEVDGEAHEALWAKEGRHVWLHIKGRSHHFEKSAGGARAAAGSGTGESILRVPMPGQVRELVVEEGQEVEAGALLLLLEAMKMEIRIQAPRAARVARLAVGAGESVEKDQILVELDGEDD